MDAGLAPRFGADDWFFKKSFFESFKKALYIDDDTNQVRIKITPTRDHIVNRQWIAEMTGLTPNPNADNSVMREYANAAMFTESEDRSKTISPLANSIAPYRDDATHLLPKQNVIRTSALQENQSFVAKWFTANFLGLENRHMVTGRAAWFLHELDNGTLLSRGWCPCLAIKQALRHLASRTDGYNLPMLCCKMWASLKGLRNHQSEYPFKGPTRKFDFFKTDIPGFWFGQRITGENAPKSLGQNYDLWRAWKVAHGEENVGGGFAYDSTGKLSIPNENEAEEEGANLHAGQTTHMDVEFAQEDTHRQGHESTHEEAQRGGQTAGFSSYSRGTWHRRTREQPDGSVPFIPYVFIPYPGAPDSLPFPVDPIPTSGYFYPEYISQYAQDPAMSIMLRMQSMQLQMSNNICRHLQTGFRFPDDTSPPPPDAGQVGNDQDDIHQDTDQ